MTKTFTPEAVAQMVADLRDGVQQTGTHEDNSTELFDIDSANGTMGSAADMLAVFSQTNVATDKTLVSDAELNEALAAIIGPWWSEASANYIRAGKLSVADIKAKYVLRDIIAKHATTLAAENARIDTHRRKVIRENENLLNALIARDQELAALRASEAAARERIAELEAATQLSLDTADMSNSTRSALLGALNSGAALTPKTNGDTP